MQKALKIMSAMAVSILYGMAVFHIYGMLLIQNDHSAFVQKTPAETVSIAKADISAGLALPGKFSFAAEAGGPVSISYFQLHKFSAAIVKSDQQILSNAYSRYVLEWLSFPVGLSVPDIIFPFHYFW